MHSKNLLRVSNYVKKHVVLLARYGAPINRWKYVIIYI